MRCRILMQVTLILLCRGFSGEARPPEIVRYACSDHSDTTPTDKGEREILIRLPNIWKRTGHPSASQSSASTYAPSSSVYASSPSTSDPASFAPTFQYRSSSESHLPNFNDASNSQILRH